VGAVRRELQTAAELAEAFLGTLDTRRVGSAASFDELVAALDRTLADEGLDPEAVVADLAETLEPGLVGTQTGRYFGFVIGSSLPAALAADWLASAWDQNGFSVVLSPAAAATEAVAGRMLVDLLGLPPDVSYGFVTGAQGANTTALAAARTHVLAGAGWDVAADGLQGAPPVQIVVGEQRHVTVMRSLRLLGFGDRAVTTVETDDQGRMLADGLAEALAGDSGPAIVCAQAGEVNTGAFDPLDEIADRCSERGAWLHVDGAFGLWAAASPARRALLAGHERADSWATDAHKWLNVPYDCGVVFCANPEAHAASMAVAAGYLQRVDGRSGGDWVPESSRRARGVPVYAALRQLGRSGVEELVERCCSHARRFAEILGAAGGVEILNDVVLNQVLVRFGDDDERTRQVVARVQEDGTCWLGGTDWKGRAAMRISVSSWRTTTADVDRSAGAILEAAASFAGAPR
jgi:glutamate/tyrosine decarboxylase-like PLP-dependent enzyme